MRRTTKSQFVAGSVAVAACSMMAAAGSAVSWADVVNGSWGSANNWSPMMVPGALDDAVLGHSDFYLVSVNGLESAASLSITNPDAVLEINPAHSLSLYGDLLNDGSIVINPVSGGSLTSLHFENDAFMTGSGTVSLNGFGPRARITSGGGWVVTNNEFHTIDGFGQVEASLINEGLISANVIDNQLFLRTNPMENRNLIEAIGGGVLNISGITLQNNFPGEIRASGADSEVRLTGSTILGGEINTNTGGQVSVTNASTLEGVHTDADLRVKNSHVLYVRDSIFNNGEILVNPTSGDSETSLEFLNPSIMEGEGAVVLNGFGVRANLKAENAIEVTNGLDHTIRGKGQIEAALVNRGLVSADVVAEELALLTYPKFNESVMEAVNGGILNILGTTIIQGDLATAGEGTVESAVIMANGIDSTIQIAGSSIIGGRVETYNEANVVVTCATTFDDVDFDGIMRILNSHRLIIREGTTNNGVILVNAEGGEGVTFVEWGEDMVLDGKGVISLLASGPRSQLIAAEGVEFAELGADQRLEGIGQISLDLLNSGEIAPGLSVGMMSATESIVLNKPSVFEAEISPSGSDLLRSVSTVELGGQLDVEFIDGFAPEAFWARTIVEASSITEAFDVVNFPVPPLGLVSKVYNSGSEFIIGQTCEPDMNVDGVLDFFDVSVFLDAFDRQDPSADLNGDGHFNFFDVSDFMELFQLGCEPAR
jgi:hypothetical protein